VICIAFFIYLFGRFYRQTQIFIIVRSLFILHLQGLRAFATDRVVGVGLGERLQNGQRDWLLYSIVTCESIVMVSRPDVEMKRKRNSKKGNTLKTRVALN